VRIGGIVWFYHMCGDGEMYRCKICGGKARYAIIDFKKEKVTWLCEKHFRKGTIVHCKNKKCRWNKNYKCTRRSIHVNFQETEYEIYGSCQEMEVVK